jgi:hypothetical protein
VRSDRRLGWLLVLAGGAIALVLQVAAPVGVPLYDGVVIPDPYRYLHPTGNELGDPNSYTATEDVTGNQSPVFAAATDESPPQAQIVAMQDAFQLNAGTTSLNVSITPVDPVAPPTNGTIAGNVYRFAVTDDAGQPVAPKSCEACRTLVLRAPDGVTEGRVQHFAEGAWTDVKTDHAGLAAMYQSNLDALGDFAVVTGATAGGPSGGLDPLIFGGIALAAFFAVVAGLFWYRRRPPPVPVVRLGPGRGRMPSKRRGPRRPPSGRS